MKTYQNYIGGEWTTSSSKKRVPNINPADTRDVLGETPMSTRDEAAAACAVAAEAFRQWRRV
ncbi:MAG TPA: aldehyde dehydrogenase family protein, partial [Kouleothrix sp.]|nr:aldehyde dehydrogenase family protein [Kouleothrix sp.]